VAVIGEESSNVSLMSRKWAASTKLSYSIKRALASLIYKGLSLYELRDFLLNYNVYFNMIKEHVIRKRIVVTALYIQDDALC
jgi:hypothetical protein